MFDWYRGTQQRDHLWKKHPRDLFLMVGSVIWISKKVFWLVDMKKHGTSWKSSQFYRMGRGLTPESWVIIKSLWKNVKTQNHLQSPPPHWTCFFFVRLDILCFGFGGRLYADYNQTQDNEVDHYQEVEFDLVCIWKSKDIPCWNCSWVTNWVDEVCMKLSDGSKAASNAAEEGHVMQRGVAWNHWVKKNLSRHLGWLKNIQWSLICSQSLAHVATLLLLLGKKSFNYKSLLMWILGS